MEHKIKIIDSGYDRYTIEPSEIVLGRQYDDKADTIVVEVPESERENLCVMVITNINGTPIDNIVLKNWEYSIRNNVSQYKYVKIGFRFINQDGYNKGSEILVGQFLPAQSPDNFVPAEPEQRANFEYITKYGFTDSRLDGNELQFFNLDGDKVVAFDLSPFIQEQSDWAETDSASETFIKNKPIIPTQTSDIINTGEDGSSPYATQEFVEQHTPIVDLSNYYTKQETYNKEEVDSAISKIDVTSQLPTMEILWEE